MKQLSKKDKQILELMRKKQVEVSNLPTQELGILTPYYKNLVSYFKVQPWKGIILLAIFIVVMFRLIFGPSFVKLATLLQAGF